QSAAGELVTPLHVASQRGNTDVAQQLLQHKASEDLGLRTCMDVLLCTMQAIKGNTEIVKLLLTSGRNKNIDDRNIWRKTALHIAAEYGHGDLINLLLSYGAAINALDNSKDTPLHCACKAGHLNAVISLINCNQRRPRKKPKAVC
uniref:ANK_REP_REGION domain-containing protein n=1 Tax=Anas platyrhynchos TaxID=8839 RepID=A0A8B9TMR5_ANAPL